MLFRLHAVGAVVIMLLGCLLTSAVACMSTINTLQITAKIDASRTSRTASAMLPASCLPVRVPSWSVRTWSGHTDQCLHYITSTSSDQHHRCDDYYVIIIIIIIIIINSSRSRTIAYIVRHLTVTTHVIMSSNPTWKKYNTVAHNKHWFNYLQIQ